MTSRFALASILIIGLLLSGAAVQSADVTAVKVSDHADRIVVRATVEGAVEAWCNQSSAGQWVTLDIRGSYRCKPVRQTIQSQAVKAVKAGWFQSNPPMTRVSISTVAKVPYELNRADEKTLELTVWKSRTKGSDSAKSGSPVSSPVSMVSPPPAPAFAVAARTDARPHTDRLSLLASRPTAPAGAFPAARSGDAPRSTEPVTRVAANTEVLDSRPATTRTLREARVPAFTNTSVGQTSPAKSISLNMVGTDINDVLKALTMQAGVNVVTAADVKGEVTVALSEVDFESALNSITKLSGYKWINEDNTYYVGSDKSISAFKSGGSTRTEVMTLNRGKAQDMLTVLKTQYPNLIAALPAQQADGKTLILTGDDGDLKAASTLIAQIDASIAPETDQTVVEVYNIRYANASSLITSLARLVPTISAASGGVPAGIKVIPPSGKENMLYRKAEGGEDSKSSGGSSGGSGGKKEDAAVSEEGSRMLVLHGTQADLARAKEILAKIDVPAPQVVIEAKVVDMGNSSDLRQGFLYDQTLNGFTIGASGTAATGTTTTRSFSAFLDATLEAEIVDGKSRLLARPKISVLEAEPATIFIGDLITYIESIQATTSGTTVTTNTVNAGIELGVMPLVSLTDQTITMRIHPEVSTPNLVTDKNTGVTLPQVSTRFADSTIRIKDGETIVIGGLINESEINNLTRIPFLSDLPFLGNLFKFRSKGTDHRELVIFITCSILKEEA